MNTETSPGLGLDPGILSDLAEVLDESPTRDPDPAQSAGEPQEPVPGSPTEPSTEPGGEPPPQEPSPGADRASAAPAASASASASQATTSWTPPAGGQPLTFHVDGKVVTVEGALRLPNGDVYVPATAWARQLVPNHLADRGTWRQQVNAWQQERAHLTQQNAGQQALLEGYLQEIKTFLALPVDQQAAQLDQWRAELPQRALQHQLGYYQWQAQQAAQQQAQTQAQTQLEAVVPQLQQELMAAVKDLTQEPSLKILAGDAEAVAKELFEDYGDPRTGGKLFFTGQDGMTYLDTDQLAQRLARLAGPRERMAQELAKVQQAAARNAAATAPTAGPGKKPAAGQQGRTKQGQFTSREPPLSAQEEVQARIMGKDFLSEE